MKTKKPKRTNPVSIDKYQAAFRKFIGNDPANFEIKEYFHNGPMLALFEGEVYRIDSIQDMFNHFREIVTNIDLAMHVPVSCWVDVAEQVHLKSDFIENLILTLNGKEEFEQLNIAIIISNHASQNATVFWNTIAALDDLELYPKAIIAACKTYDLDCKIHELMNCMISDGNIITNLMEDSIIETIDLDENDCSPNDSSFFYIYTVPQSFWDTNN